jgi:hypothetical protein
MGWPVQSSFLVSINGGELTRVPGTASSLFQKVAIVFDGNTSTMLARFMYTGHGDLFGCIGTIPVDAQIKPVDASLFSRMDQLSGMSSFAKFRNEANEPYFNARTVELVNFEIQRSMDEMAAWKKRNGFREITDREHEVFQYYLDKGMMFLTALVPYGYAIGDDEQVNVWTQPVQISFKSDRVWYPLRGSTVEDVSHSYISLDLLTPGRPAELPSFFQPNYEGLFELGHRDFTHTRIEADLSVNEMENDIELSEIMSERWRL